MADFPTLSRPLPVSLDQGVTSKGDLKHEDDAGYQITRRRYTRANKSFSASYALLSDADAILLDDFFNLVTTVTPFNWTQPSTGIVYSVRFSPEIPVLKIIQLHWSVNCIMVEV